MFPPSWLNSLHLSPKPTHQGRGLRRKRPRKPCFRFEVLEDRALLATFTVTHTADCGAGSLRQAILDANASSGPDTIEFNIGALVGISDKGGGLVQLSRIDTCTGVATPLADFNLCSNWSGAFSLAFHEPSGNYLTIGTAGGSPALAVLDPWSGAARQFAITGLPEDQMKISGLGYAAATDQILITFGQTGTTLENRVAEINLSGVVQTGLARLGAG